MIYWKEKIEELGIRVFDQAGDQIGLPLLIDSTKNRVWCYPIFVRDCPNPCEVLDGVVGDADVAVPGNVIARTREWAEQRGPVEFTYAKMEMRA